MRDGLKHENRRWKQYGSIFILFLIGWSMFFVSSAVRSIEEVRSARESFIFRQRIQQLDKRDHDQLLKVARTYNQTLDNQGDLIDPFVDDVNGAVTKSSAEPTDVQSNEDGAALYGSDIVFNTDQVFGVLRIPKLDLEQAIYLGSTVENMNHGATVVEGSSLPIGGLNTHCVLAGHNVQTRGVNFSNIDELIQGDELIVESPAGKLTYIVKDVVRVPRNDIDYLRPEVGKDKLSLLTCYKAQSKIDRYVVEAYRAVPESKLNTSSITQPTTSATNHDVAQPIVEKENYLSNLIGFSSQVLGKVLLRLLLFISVPICLTLIIKRRKKRD